MGDELNELLGIPKKPSSTTPNSGWHPFGTTDAKQGHLSQIARFNTQTSIVRLANQWLEGLENKDKKRPQWEEAYEEGVWKHKNLGGEAIVDTKTGRQYYIPSPWLPLFTSGTFLNDEYPKTGNPEDDPPWGLPTADKILRWLDKFVDKPQPDDVPEEEEPVKMHTSSELKCGQINPETGEIVLCNPRLKGVSIKWRDFLGAL